MGYSLQSLVRSIASRSGNQGNDGADNDNDWIPMADMLLGLMITFLVIAVTLQLYYKTVPDADVSVHTEQLAELEAKMAVIAKDVATRVAISLDGGCIVLDAGELFMFDTNRWTLDKERSDAAKKKMEQILSPVILSPLLPKLTLSIEGHASPEFSAPTGNGACIDSYTCNMELSTKRSITVFAHVYTVLSLGQVTGRSLASRIEIRGMSSSKPGETAEKSRRVLMKVCHINLLEAHKVKI